MRRLPLVFLIAVLGSSSAWAFFDDKEARRQIADLQINAEARFDQQARAQLELSAQIQRQAEEIARLRGQIETLTHELEQSRKRQQDFYLDLDSRLRKLEPQQVADSAAATDRLPGRKRLSQVIRPRKRRPTMLRWNCSRLASTRSRQPLLPVLSINIRPDRWRRMPSTGWAMPGMPAQLHQGDRGAKPDRHALSGQRQGARRPAVDCHLSAGAG